jgi:hypothetical protein
MFALSLSILLLAGCNISANNGESAQRKTSNANVTSTKNTGASNPKQSSEVFKYKTYENGRFGFTVQYPDTFTEGLEPTNDDGREFDNGECKIIAAAINVLDGETIQTEYKKALANAKGPISYQRVGANWFVVSYKDGNNIVYEKSIIQNGTSYDLNIAYPSSKQAKYGPMVTHIVSTFIPGHGQG